MRAYASLYCLAFAIASVHAESATTSIYVVPLKSKLELEVQPFPVDISFSTLPVLFSSVLQTLDTKTYNTPVDIEEEYLWMNPILNSSTEEEIKGNLMVLVSGLTDGSEILPKYKPTLQLADPPSPNEFNKLANELTLTSWETFGGSWKTHYSSRHGSRVEIRTENLFLNERLPSAQVTDDEAYGYFLNTYQLAGADQFDPEIKEDMAFIREIEYTTRLAYRYSWLAGDYPSDSPNLFLVSLSGLDLLSRRYGPGSAKFDAGKAILHELLEKTMMPLFEQAHDGRSTASLITIPSDPLQIPFLEESGHSSSGGVLEGETLRSVRSEYWVIGLTILALLVGARVLGQSQILSRANVKTKPAPETHESSSEEELDHMNDSETDYEEETSPKHHKSPAKLG